MPWFRTKKLICIFRDVCRPHTGMTNTPQKYENAFLLKTYRSYPLKVVIFRARFFKAQHAMVSSVVVVVVVMAEYEFVRFGGEFGGIPPLILYPHLSLADFGSFRVCFRFRNEVEQAKVGTRGPDYPFTKH